MAKFGTDVDEVLYTASLDGGPDEEVGDVQDFGWYGLLRFKAEPDGSVREFDDYAVELELSPDEIAEDLRGHAGGIIYEDSQGFVDVTLFKTEGELEKAWDELLSEAEEFYGEEDSEGEEEEEEEEAETEEEPEEAP